MMDIKTAGTRANYGLMLAMLALGSVTALGVQWLVVDPDTTIISDPMSRNPLADIPHWWIGVLCLVVALPCFVPIPRLLRLLSDGEVCRLDRDGIRVMTLGLRRIRIPWRELESVELTPFGIRVKAHRRGVTIPMILARSATADVIRVFHHFRPDLIAASMRRFA